MAMTPIREKAVQVLSKVPPFGSEIRSTNDGVRDNPEFTALTNTSHSRMKQDWLGYPDKVTGIPTKPPGIMTGCNGFTGYYAAMLGQPIGRPLGVFEIEATLKQYNMGHAWVPSTADNRPKYGDICRWHTKYHVDVSLDFEGEIWTHADAGQGGKSTGYDILKRVRETKPYSHTWLKGWIDIDLAFGASLPAPVKVPDWLLNWWKVDWRGQRFYYLFEKDRKVTWTQHSPLSAYQPAIVDGGAGKYEVALDGAITVKWADTEEKFANPGPYPEIMKGLWNGAETITATHLF